MPARITRVVGRDQAIGQLLEALRAHRFVTLTGPGGIGKTTVAVEVARRHVLATHCDVCFVDLSTVHEPGLVAASLASSLGTGVNSFDVLPQVVETLRGRRILVVLDSCEHVIDAVAQLSEELFRSAPDAFLLATSREPLRASDEYVHRLNALECPAREEQITSCTEALTYAAVQLFVDRAAARVTDFALDDQSATAVCEICQHLDGNALAIELAAGRVDALGISGIRELLSDRLRLLSEGWRTATPRHRTLEATLDWSYELLAEDERSALQWLSVLVGPFSVEAARAIAGDGRRESADVLPIVASLVAKSLVMLTGSGMKTHYYLPETTRDYALNRLLKAGQFNAASRRHAHHVLQQLNSVSADALDHASTQDTELRSGLVANIRAALNWSFSIEGDRRLAVALAATAGPLLLDASLLAECQRWTEQALSELAPDQRGTETEMALQSSRAVTLPFTHGNGEEVSRSWHRALDIAQAVHDEEYQLRILDGLFVYHLRTAHFDKALSVAMSAEDLARVVPSANPTTPKTEWMLGIALHFMGEHAAAKQYCEAALSYAPMSRRANMVRFGVDPRLHAYCALARTYWLLGSVTQARSCCQAAIQEAQSVQHPTSLCMALTWATAVPLWCGDLEAAEVNIRHLQALARANSLAPYQAISLGLEGQLEAKRRDWVRAADLLRGSIERLRAMRHQMLVGVFLGDLGQCLGALGHTADGLAAVNEGIIHIEKHSELLYLPDILRVRAELIALTPNAAPEVVTQAYKRAIQCAQEQGVPAWELLTAFSHDRWRRTRAPSSEVLVDTASLAARIDATACPALDPRAQTA